MNSADQMGRLVSLRLKMKSKNLSRAKSEEISENEMPVGEREFRRGEPIKKYGDTARKIEIGEINKHGAFSRMPFL